MQYPVRGAGTDLGLKLDLVEELMHGASIEVHLQLDLVLELICSLNLTGF